jgi:3'(2'), 5'-bisphosphate nucleotidase
MSCASAALLESIGAIARLAADEILAIYAQGPIAATAKEDASPLTAADLAAHALITHKLRELTPELPVLSEEAADTSYAERALWQCYWLVDPLDGTKEFLSRNGQFTVNIALIEEHAPVLGVVHVPTSDTSYRGWVGQGAWRVRGADAAVAIRVAQRSATPLRVVGSRSHRGDSLDAFLRRAGPHELVSLGSSLKFCVVAEGAADVYPRLGPTSEWDTAAAQAVLTGAGGSVRALDGSLLRYNTRAELRNPFFVGYGPQDRDWLAMLR